MAYATVEELAAALRIRVTDTNRDSLQLDLDAAAEVIDQVLDRPPGDPLPDPPPPVVRHVNIVAGVELAKAADATFGVVGYPDIGALRVSAVDAVARHIGLLMPYKTRFGVA